MKFEKQKATQGAGPSSAIGLIRFFDTEAGGPKLSPEFVVIMSVAVIVLLLVIHFFS